MRISLNLADKLFSLLVRERAGNICERCGRSDGKLDCSHHWSRRIKLLRWDPQNAMALCFLCHQWWHGFPGESGVWLRNKIGEDQYAYLVAKAQEPFKLDTAMKKHILKNLKFYWANKESLIVINQTAWLGYDGMTFPQKKFVFPNPYEGTVEPIERKKRKKVKKKSIKRPSVRVGSIKYLNG